MERGRKFESKLSNLPLWTQWKCVRKGEKMNATDFGKTKDGVQAHLYTIKR